MKKEQDEYIYLTVYSEPHVQGYKNTDHVKIEITTGGPEYPDLVEMCILDDENKHIMTFTITETTARYICNYLKTYLDVINDKKY